MLIDPTIHPRGPQEETRHSRSARPVPAPQSSVTREVSENNGRGWRKKEKASPGIGATMAPLHLNTNFSTHLLGLLSYDRNTGDSAGEGKQGS